MTIPTRSEAAGILLDLGAPSTLMNHMRVVAEVGAFLAARAAERGHAVDRSLVESAALLHDLDKALPEGHRLRSLGHGHAGAAWLEEHDRGELAPCVASHPVMRLVTPDADRWLERSTLEERIVAYADKRAAQRLGPVDARFRRWYRAHPGYAEGLRAARGRAALLERDVCDAAGVDPREVRRLRWVDTALESAARGRAARPGSAR